MTRHSRATSPVRLCIAPLVATSTRESRTRSLFTCVVGWLVCARRPTACKESHLSLSVRTVAVPRWDAAASAAANAERAVAAAVAEAQRDSERRRRATERAAADEAAVAAAAARAALADAQRRRVAQQCALRDAERLAADAIAVAEAAARDAAATESKACGERTVATAAVFLSAPAAASEYAMPHAARHRALVTLPREPTISVDDEKLPVGGGVSADDGKRGGDGGDGAARSVARAALPPSALASAPPQWSLPTPRDSPLWWPSHLFRYDGIVCSASLLALRVPFRCHRRCAVAASMTGGR